MHNNRAASRENLSSGFLTRSDTNRAVVTEDDYRLEISDLESRAIFTQLICAFVFENAKRRFPHDETYFQIYDGDPWKHGATKRLCGQLIILLIFSKENVIILHFRSNDHMAGTGFRIRHSTFTDIGTVETKLKEVCCQ